MIKQQNAPPDFYGPALPPNFATNSRDSSNTKVLIGPTLPDNFTLDDNEYCSASDDFIGPMPSSSFNQNGDKDVTKYLKALKQAEKFERKNTKREEWMLELPKNKTKKFSLSSRKFLKRNIEKEDPSVWTNILGQEKISEPKVNEDTFEEKRIKKRNDDMKCIAANLNEQRSMPLIESYKNSLLVKPLRKERVAFNRETDLVMTQLSNVQKEKILKKCNELDNRFSAGKQQFL